MTAISVTLRDGTEREIALGKGLSVMEVIRNAGVDEMLALCGGCLSGATCHVIVDGQWFAAVGDPSRDEDDLLDSTKSRTATSRLSCQIPMTPALSGLRVMMAPED